MWNLAEYCKLIQVMGHWLILKSVRLCPLVVKIFDHLVDVLINTSPPSTWLNSVAWPFGPVLKFRDIADCWSVCRAKRARNENDHARDWRDETAALVSRVRLVVSMLVRACTLHTKSEEKEDLIQPSIPGPIPRIKDLLAYFYCQNSLDFLFCLVLFCVKTLAS